MIRHFLFFSLFFTLTAEANPQFIKEWRKFVHQKQIDFSRIGSFDHIQNEFSYIEEFGALQQHRRRPGIKGTDHNLNSTPYLENKVTLRDGTEISASQISFETHLEPGYHHFIASQSPKSDRVHLFWQMIWEKQVNQLVMVTELQETNRTLCPCYWPEKVGQTVRLDNGIELKLVKESTLLPKNRSSIQVKTIHVSYKGRMRPVTHYWYRNWMDHTAPVEPTPILTLIDTVKKDKAHSLSSAPIVVHCHGGVGRTGVFVTLYHMLQRHEMGDTPISLFQCVSHLRWQRNKMVGNPIQYQFCHGVLRALGI